MKTIGTTVQKVTKSFITPQKAFWASVVNNWPTLASDIPFPTTPLKLTRERAGHLTLWIGTHTAHSLQVKYNAHKLLERINRQHTQQKLHALRVLSTNQVPSQSYMTPPSHYPSTPPKKHKMVDTVVQQHVLSKKLFAALQRLGYWIYHQ